jgi:hypothetical protein
MSEVASPYDVLLLVVAAVACSVMGWRPAIAKCGERASAMLLYAHAFGFCTVIVLNACARHLIGCGVASMKDVCNMFVSGLFLSLMYGYLAVLRRMGPHA